MYLIRGIEALTHIIIYINITAFTPNIILDCIPHKLYPPNINNDIIVDIPIIFPYSPKKKYANAIEEYSVLNPDTNSDSASGKSNGALFVSLIPPIINIIPIPDIGNINHTPFWYSTIDIIFVDSPIIIISIIINAIISSYDIICAVVLNDPSIAYLLFPDHPANIIPITPNDDINNIYIILCFISINIIPLLYGITTNINILNINVIVGDIKNIILFDSDNIIVSFIINFTPSLIGCNIPIIPTFSGPFLLCILPITLRSANVINAIDIN